MDSLLQSEHAAFVLLGTGIGIVALMNYFREGVNLIIGSAMLFFSIVQTWLFYDAMHTEYYVGQEVLVYGLAVIVWLGWSAALLSLGVHKAFEKEASQ